MPWYIPAVITLLWAPYILLVVLVLLRLKSQQIFELTTVPEVTVIVAFRNESEKLSALISALKAQSYTYAKFVLINDHSEDESLQLAKSLTKGNTRFTVLSLPEGITGKKRAIQEALNQTKTSIILFTDADCKPNPGWISCMVGAMQHYWADFISGTVLIDSPKNMFERLQAIELNFLVALGHGLIELGYPLLCNAASMGITEKIAKLPVNLQKASGDDVFRLHESFAHRFNIIYLNHPESHVFTKAEQNFKSWFHQRLRWAAKTPAYRPLSLKVLSSIIVLGQVSLILFLFIFPIWLWLILLSLKITTETILMVKAEKIYKQSYSLTEIVLVGLIYPFSTLVMGILSPLVSPKWKGRSI